MANKAERGTKRTCQNTGCGARFYDLNRDPILCPVCSTVYSLPLTAAAGAASAESARRAKKPEFVEAVAGEAPEVEAEDALVDVDAGDEDIAAGEEETFLEQEEDEGGDVSGIIGGGSGEGEEES
jgi:uncharacterized protein (TIGR02300 family)